jgi:hypothetical protein
MTIDQKQEYSVPTHLRPHEGAFMRGYRAARHRDGAYRVNLVAMQYEPEEPMGEAEFAAWTEGFRAGFLDRRAAGDPS